MTLVAVLEIGQSPRPDLLQAVGAALPAGVDVLELGALDGIDDAAIPAPGPDAANPLFTRLANGRRILVDEAWVAPHLQAAARRADMAGADAVLLLCAGGFEDLVSERPLIRPARVVAAALGDAGARSTLVVVPAPGQLAASAAKWRAAGIEPVMLACALPDGVDAVVDAAASGSVDAVVLDYVGHPAELVDRLVAALAAATNATLYDLGREGARGLARSLGTIPATGAHA